MYVCRLYVCFFKIDADLAKLYPELTFSDQLWDDFSINFRVHFWNRVNDEQSKKIYDELCSMDELTTPSGNWLLD